MTTVENGPGQRGFTKLDVGIVDSTIWMKSHEHLRVWVALLAKSDALGNVRASIPAMAHLCQVERGLFEEIITDFAAPDPDSRTSRHEGRRIEIIEGGWHLLNYEAYRNTLQRKPLSGAERQKRYRAKKQSKRNASNAEARPLLEAEAEAEAEKDISSGSATGDETSPEERSDDELTPQQLKVRQVLDIYPRVKPGFAAKWVKEWESRFKADGMDKLLGALRGMMDDGLATESPDYITKALRSALRYRAGDYKPKRSGGDDFEARRRAAGATADATGFD